MKNTINLLFVIAFQFMISQSTSAQLVVNSGGTAQQIVNALIGSGLSVSNVVLNCGANSSTAAYGTFDGTNSNLGLPNGILLTTGQAGMAVGPNNLDGQGFCNNHALVDSQLISIEPMATNDVCILEMDVVPHCTSMTLRFVFASEEYPEYVNSVFNDAFGFFVTGPDPTCGSGLYNNTNVALLPNGTPVSINNINDGYAAGCPATLPGPCTNCSYYINNCGCTAPSCIQYDGFTVPLIVNLSVCPCATYHWKFAIGDAGDCVWDSGILIEYLASCVAALNYTVNSADTSCTCNNSASVNITDGTPPYTYEWSPIGQTGATATGLCAGNYTVTVSDALSCNPPVVEFFTIAGSGLSSTVSQSDVLCNGGNTGSASVTVSSGIPPYTYAWSTIPVQTSATATGLAAGNYTVQITDSAGCVALQDVMIYEPSVLTLSTVVTQPSCISCSDGIIHLYPGGGAAPPYTYTISPSAGTFADTAFINMPSGEYNICLIDTNGCELCDSVIVPQNTTGILSIQNSGNIILSPNPVTSGATLKIDFTPHDDTAFQVYDAVGKMVTEIKINSMNTIIDKAALPAKGIYLWHVVAGAKEVARGKLVMMN